MRARSSGSRVEIGAMPLRRERRDWTSHLAAPISLSIMETAAVCDVGGCVMTLNWLRNLRPDWRRVNRSEKPAEVLRLLSRLHK